MHPIKIPLSDVPHSSPHPVPPVAAVSPSDGGGNVPGVLWIGCGSDAVPLRFFQLVVFGQSGVKTNVPLVNSLR